MFFFLVQTEQGDIFKITLEVDYDLVTEIKLKYFDTVPCATAMNVLKTGFLFVASEFGNHYLYQVCSLPHKLGNFLFILVFEGCIFEVYTKNIHLARLRPYVKLKSTVLYMAIKYKSGVSEHTCL